MNLIEHYNNQSITPWKREPNIKSFPYSGRPCHIFRDSMGVLHGVVGFTYAQLGGDEEYYSTYHLPGTFNNQPVKEYSINSLPELPEAYSGYPVWMGFSGAGGDYIIPSLQNFSFSTGKKYYSMQEMENDLREFAFTCNDRDE